MGNNTCCEQEAKGGEFSNTAKSHFQPNKINLQPHKLSNITFADPSLNIKIVHDDPQPNNHPSSPPAKLTLNNKWSKMSEDLPIIPEAELRSKAKPKGEERQSFELAEQAKERDDNQMQLERSIPQQSSHSSAMRKSKPAEQNSHSLHIQSHDQPHGEILKEQLIKEQEKPPEIIMPQLTKEAKAAIESQNLIQDNFDFPLIRRQYDTQFYEGQVDGSGKLPHGLGKYYKSNQSVYVGHFMMGKAHGQGAIVFADGSYYRGPFSNNFAQGKGGVYSSKDFRYEGDFKGSCFHGRGNERGLTHEFKGEYYDGKKTNGVFTWTQNQSQYEYEGSFDKGLFNGEGTLKEPMGTYTGEFIQGKKHGNGVYEYKNGLKFQGEYRAGLRTGKGVLFNPNNKIAYQGQFDKGLPHGHGFIFDKLGRKCSTKWLEGIDAQLL